MNNVEVLRRTETRKLLFTLGKRRFKYLGYITGKEGLENLKLRRYIEAKREKSKHRVIDLISICKWMTEHKKMNGKESNVN